VPRHGRRCLREAVPRFPAPRRAWQDSFTSWPAVAPRRRRGRPPSPAACRGSRLPWVAPSRGHLRRPPPAEDLRGVPWARGALDSCSPRPHNSLVPLVVYKSERSSRGQENGCCADAAFVTKTPVRLYAERRNSDTKSVERCDWLGRHHARGCTRGNRGGCGESESRAVREDQESKAVVTVAKRVWHTTKAP